MDLLSAVWLDTVLDTLTKDLRNMDMGNSFSQLGLGIWCWGKLGPSFGGSGSLEGSVRFSFEGLMGL